MGLLFLFAGYFVAPAFDSKGAARFLRDRAIRLGIPSLFFMLVIHPVTVYWLLRTFDDPLFHPFHCLSAFPIEREILQRERTHVVCCDSPYLLRDLRRSSRALSAPAF